MVAETVPYAVPDVGQEELKYPVCHWQFKTNYRLQRHMDIHKGSGYPCSFLPQVSVILQDAKASRRLLVSWGGNIPVLSATKSIPVSRS